MFFRHGCLFAATAFLMALLVAAAPPVPLSDYVTHPCKRNCLDPGQKSMRCEYNFTLETYQTLSRACYDCPNTAADCARPHCIPGDGFVRAVKVVNRMLPGPALHVCQGDTVVVNVYNQLGDYEGTSIHWHGILQEGSPYMDGVTMVTQCPIPSQSSFQYRFEVPTSGTHYWHAHAGLQRGDGLSGALVVRDTSFTDVMKLYDVDLPEHTIIIQDWLDQFTTSKFSIHHHSAGDNTPASIIINGRATTFGKKKTAIDHGSMDMDTVTQTPQTNTTATSTATTTVNHEGHVMGKRAVTSPDTMTPPSTGMEGHNMSTSNGSTTNDYISYVPHQVFSVAHGKRYRFRIINNGVLNCPLKVSVQDHNLSVIASDGYDMKPVLVDSITIFAGERYDFVLSANQKPDNYWLYVMGLGDCARSKTSQTAIIRYEGQMETKPTAGEAYLDTDRTGKNANPYLIKPDTVSVAQMTSSFPADDVFNAHHVKKYYILLGYNRVENYRQ
ncbi:hypothetical protein DPMN_172732, partial [Dreissena polymorpha]